MMSDRFVTEVTAALTVIEREVDRDGWDTDPVLMGLFQMPQGAFGMANIPIPPGVWNLGRTGIGIDVPHWVTVEVIVRYLTGDGTAAFDRWLRRDTRSWLGFVYCGEGLDTQRGMESEDPHVTADGGIAVRALIARDIDGRTYQIIRERSTPERTVTTVAVQAATSSIPLSLDQLLAAAAER